MCIILIVYFVRPPMLNNQRIKYNPSYHCYSNVSDEWLPIGKRWLAWFLVSGFVLSFLMYATVALLPYAGPLRVDPEMSVNWSINNFLGDSDGDGNPINPLPERVMLLPDCREAFDHRIMMVSNARERVDFVSFVATPGWSPEIFFGALIEAANREVEVNIVVDAKFFDFGDRYASPLSSHSNINYYEFNPINLFRPWYINHALHDKIMIVDNEFLIIGGRNLGDKYPDFGGFVAEYYNDLEVLVHRPRETPPDLNDGGIIAETRDYVESIRDNFLTRERRSNDSTSNRLARERMVGTYHDYLNYIEQKGFSPDYSDANENIFPAYNISLLFNPIEGTRKEPLIAYNLLRIARESDDVLIHTPYVVLTRRNLRLLSDAIAGTSEFTIITNSMASVGDLWAYGSYHIRRRDVARAGHDTPSDFRLYEFQHPTHSLHLKAYAFDDRLTAIGAYNMSERSTRIITDSMLVIDSPELNAAARQNAQRFKAGSLRVDRDGRYYNPSDRSPDQLIEVVDPPFWKNLRLTIQGILFEPFRFLV